MSERPAPAGPGPAVAILQALVYGGVAAFLWERSVVDGGLFAAAAGAQLVAAGTGRRPRVRAVAAALSLLAAAAVWARFFLLAMEIQAVFGPEPGGQALSALGGTAVAIPWLLVVPVLQLRATGWGRAALLLVLAPVPGVLVPGLDPAPAAPLAAAGGAWATWSTGAPPTGFDPAETYRVTALRDGAPLADPVAVEGGDTAPLAERLRRLGPPGPEDALLVDRDLGPTPGGLVRLGLDGPPRDSPALAARSVRREQVFPGVWLPRAEGARRSGTALVSAAGVVVLREGWAPRPVADSLPSPEAIDEAVRAGAAFLAHSQADTGRFAYIVKGPEGTPGSGYNYPRHAGTAWYLARVAAALGDPVAATAADRALAHLDTRTFSSSADGRTHVRDPARKDGRSWIGTVALATLAEVTRRRDPGPFPPPDSDRLDGWARQLVASVDDRGFVQSEMLLSDGTFPEQVANAYGQGQAMLALAALARGVPGLDPALSEGARAALVRAAGYVDDGYYGTRHPLFVPDEHWMCLAAFAYGEVIGARAEGMDGSCATYVAQMRLDAPRAGAPRPAAGPAGGGAEAVIARAWDTRDPSLIELSHRYAGLFLDQQYRAADAPLLGDAAALLGGFRDTAGDLDVQIDSVQHIGAALLGVEALLSGRARPGSMP